MKRLLIGFLAGVGLTCLLRRRHEPKRQPIGGWRCDDCGKAAADLAGMVSGEGGYVDPARRLGPRGHELDTRFRRAGG